MNLIKWCWYPFCWLKKMEARGVSETNSSTTHTFSRQRPNTSPSQRGPFAASTSTSTDDWLKISREESCEGPGDPLTSVGCQWPLCRHNLRSTCCELLCWLLLFFWALMKAMWSPKKAYFSETELLHINGNDKHINLKQGKNKFTFVS